MLFLFQLKKNVLNVDFHIAKYGQIVEELRKEVRIINNKIIKNLNPYVTSVLHQSINHQNGNLNSYISCIL